MKSKTFFRGFTKHSTVKSQREMICFLASLDWPQLNEEPNEEMTATISEEELKQALGVRSEGSAGPEGPTAEWYEEVKAHGVLSERPHWAGSETGRNSPSRTEAPTRATWKTRRKAEHTDYGLHIDSEGFPSIMARRLEELHKTTADTGEHRQDSSCSRPYSNTTTVLLISVDAD